MSAGDPFESQQPIYRLQSHEPIYVRAVRAQRLGRLGRIRKWLDEKRGPQLQNQRTAHSNALMRTNSEGVYRPRIEREERIRIPT